MKPRLIAHSGERRHKPTHKADSNNETDDQRRENKVLACLLHKARLQGHRMKNPCGASVLTVGQGFGGHLVFAEQLVACVIDIHIRALAPLCFVDSFAASAPMSSFSWWLQTQEAFSIRYWGICVQSMTKC